LLGATSNPWQQSASSPAGAAAMDTAETAAESSCEEATGSATSPSASESEADSESVSQGVSDSDECTEPTPLSPSPRKPKCMNGEVWNHETECTRFASGKCSKWHCRPWCNERAACKALASGKCKLHHPRSDIFRVLGAPHSDKVKEYWKFLGFD
jgi:hypothetical protein